MKNFARSIAIIALVLVTVTSCNKEKINVPTSADKTILSKALTTYTLVRDEGGPSCPEPAGNCTKITHITAGHDYGLAAIFTAIRSGVQANIVSAFIAEKSSLIEVVDQAHIDAVINEVFIAELDEDEEETYYLILNESTNVEVAYRFAYD